VSRVDRIVHRLKSRPPAPPAADLQAMSARMDSLEAMVEGLQDAVDRETTRLDARIDELARQLQPSELARVLSADARKRGL
jgi:hypothetical protein